MIDAKIIFEYISQSCYIDLILVCIISETGESSNCAEIFY
jgi:hypothetical protein